MLHKTKIVKKIDVLSKTKCPPGSFRHMAKELGFDPIDSTINNGRFTLLYSWKLIDAMGKHYGWKDGAK
ncbi:MAG: hypothetical protein GY797_33465 [Deltaproteobacteria bacterium]|nr:hypothetical protein [Deltaproteobacteria bacterium]